MELIQLTSDYEMKPFDCDSVHRHSERSSKSEVEESPTGKVYSWIGDPSAPFLRNSAQDDECL